MPDESRGGLLDLPEAASAALRSIAFELRYPKRYVLFREGDPAEGVILLRTGSIKISISSSQGGALILGIARPCEALGLNSVLRGEPSQTSAESLETCDLTFYPRKEFLKFMSEHVEAWFLVVQQLANSYEIACGALRQICFAASASERVAKFLLQWTGQSPDSAESFRNPVGLTREEIGQTIGISRETVIRTLGEFKQRGLAVLEKKRILIPDRLALASFARGREV